MVDKEHLVKLELVRLEGIAKLLSEKCDSNLLELRVENLLETEIKNLKKSLLRLSKKQLVDLAEKSNELTNEDIDEIYDLFRYGLKPGFVLNYIGKSQEIEKQELQMLLDCELNSVQYQEDDQYKNLRLKSIERISVDTLEVSFDYLCKYTYISEEEKPEYVYELKQTFVWINIKEGYLAVKNVANSIMCILKEVFSRVYKTRVTTMRLTKQMINEIFGENKMRKGTFYNPKATDKEAEKVTISDVNLAEKPNVREAFKGYDMTSSSLIEQVGEDTISTLGINCKEGKIYLTKNLSAIEFRSWSLKRIKDIISYMNGANFEDFSCFRVKNVMDDVMWKNYSEAQKKIIEKIIFSIYCAKKHKLESFSLECVSDEIIKTCNNLFNVRITYVCEQCGEMCVAQCPNCSSSKLVMNKKRQLICSECGEKQEAIYKLQCDTGHITSFSGVERIVELQPNCELMNKVRDTLCEYFDYELLENEYFYIHDGNLTIIKIENIGQLLSKRDLPELKPIFEIDINRDERDVLLDRFMTIKEKCRKHGNKACNQCQYNEQECIMKLFMMFDFRPSPHQNSEFGDVNFQVKYKGNLLRLVGIAKSRIPSQDNLTVSTTVGREIIQQMLTMTHDKRVDVIAVICPMRFHHQLVAEIEYLARITGKRAIVLDDEFMIRLLKQYDKLQTNE